MVLLGGSSHLLGAVTYSAHIVYILYFSCKFPPNNILIDRCYHFLQFKVEIDRIRLFLCATLLRFVKMEIYVLFM